MFLPGISLGLANKRDDAMKPAGHLVFLLLSGFLGLPSRHSNVSYGFNPEAPKGREQLAPISAAVNQASVFGLFPSKLIQV